MIFLFCITVCWRCLSSRGQVRFTSVSYVTASCLNSDWLWLWSKCHSHLLQKQSAESFLLTRENMLLVEARKEPAESDSIYKLLILSIHSQFKQLLNSFVPIYSTHTVHTVMCSLCSYATFPFVSHAVLIFAYKLQYLLGKWVLASVIHPLC